jgi:hypothetical protein
VPKLEQKIDGALAPEGMLFETPDQLQQHKATASEMMDNKKQTQNIGAE